MSPLYVPFWKRVLGSAAGWTVYGLMRALYALPRPVLLTALDAISVAKKVAAGETATSRALDFVRRVLRDRGNTAAVLDRVIRRSRPYELVGIVRGVVVRSLS